ncbi:MAG TPA: hypothetical protein VGH38_07920 [Bryobacteraceae bacterium]|jgi:hypothetical protein
MMNQIFTYALAIGMFGAALLAADHPEAAISNGSIRARVALPDATKGYYRGTRFDWSGLITSLESQGHNYFAPFYEKFDPAVRDVDFKQTVLAGPISAVSGPAEEFSVIGYPEAKTGGTFLKIGVGALKKPEEPRYDHYFMYEIAVPGKWTVHKTGNQVEMTQEVHDPASGYGYIYRKTIRLLNGQPKMVLEHSLKNVGGKALEGNVYDHNFFVIDHQPTGPDFALKFAFEPKTAREMPKSAEMRDRQINYLNPLGGGDVVQTQIQGFGAAASDYDFRVENRKTGAGVHVTGDHPLSRMMLWSIRTTVCPEAFVDFHVEPGQEFKWDIQYEFYSLPGSSAPRP